MDDEDEIAERWLFTHLPHSARRNDGRIRDSELYKYREPLKGGWGVEGYDPTNWEAEPELRCFKPDSPRLDKKGKPIKYDFPKNGKHNPLFARVPNGKARIIFERHGLDFSEMAIKYSDNPQNWAGNVYDECKWFWKAVLGEGRIPITVTEGAKKALSLLSHGYVAIAVSSITTWMAERGVKTVHPWVEPFCKGRKVNIAFDQDIKEETRKAVKKQAYWLSKGCKEAGAADIRILSWGVGSKGIDDFIYSTLQSKGEKGVEKQLRIIHETTRSWHDLFSDDKLPGTTIKVNQRYLDKSIFEAVKDYKIICTKSPKGTGKTTIYSWYVDELIKQGTPVNAITHLQA